VEEPVELTLKNLPPHKLVRVTFDLYLFRCWDGSSKLFGVKLFDLDVVGKPNQNLLHTTFSNAGFFSDNNEQAFPDPYPCRPHPAWTGAAEKQTLGTVMSWGGPERTHDSSGVYHFVLTFPHEEDSIKLRYKATMQRAKDKWWGVANYKVETISELKVMGEKGLARNWEKLGSYWASEAYEAAWAMAQTGDLATDFIAKHLKEKCDATADEIKPWIVGLKSDDKAVVSDAFNNLVVQGKNVEKFIDAALEDAGDVKNEYTRLLKRIKWMVGEYSETATELRNHRVRQLLGIIHTEKAIKLQEGIPAHKDPVIDPEWQEAHPLPIAN
jgi:hypothetical protein